jgi:nucleoside phosphorylase
MTLLPLCIVCFAVKEEARFFKGPPKSKFDLRPIVTGMGARNAEKAIRKILEKEKPVLVLSCGFGGALNPELPRDTVVFAVDTATNLQHKLISTGAIPAVFHCAREVATTARQKSALWHETGADVVEMESGVICNICRVLKIPSGTVRVILDVANEDLPLDFNELMTEDQRLDFGKLASLIARSPSKIASLLRLQRQSAAAARKLALVLENVLAE